MPAPELNLCSFPPPYILAYFLDNFHKIAFNTQHTEPPDNSIRKDHKLTEKKLLKNDWLFTILRRGSVKHRLRSCIAFVR